MALPRRPLGSPPNSSPRQHNGSNQEDNLPAIAEDDDFALPSLDDLALPELNFDAPLSTEVPTIAMVPEEPELPELEDNSVDESLGDWDGLMAESEELPEIEELPDFAEISENEKFVEPSNDPIIPDEDTSDSLDDDNWDFLETPAEEPADNAETTEDESIEDPSWDEIINGEEESPAEVPESEEETEEEQVQTPLKKRDRNRGKNKKPAKTPRERKNPKGGWNNGSNKLIGKLASIPLLGIIFKPLTKIAGLVTAVLCALPLIAIPLVGYFIIASAVPSEAIAKGPDSSSVLLSSFFYGEGEARAVVSNTGDVVADVTSTLEVWTYNPFGGGSIFAFDKVSSCEPIESTVPIDETVQISVACDSAPGLVTKVTGSINF